MKYTANFNLKKPDLEDYVDVADLNENMDSVDEIVGKLEQTVATHFTDDEKRIKVKQGITILATGWTLNSRTKLYEYNLNDADIFATTVVDVNIKVTDLEKASDLLPANESFDGYVKLFADYQPTSNIVCDLKLIRQVF